MAHRKGLTLVATFADYADYGDEYANGALPKWTFQAAPTPQTCNPFIAQTPHRAGMVVSMGDSSVRTVNPGISREAYWAAVTPGGGEVFATDW